MSIAQFWFNFNNAFSGMKYYTEGVIQMYNVLYTSVPIVLMAAYDMDVLSTTVHRNPQLYHACIDNEYFRSSSIWSWIVSAFVESIIMSVVPLYTLSNSQLGYGLVRGLLTHIKFMLKIVLTPYSFLVSFTPPQPPRARI